MDMCLYFLSFLSVVHWPLKRKDVIPFLWNSYFILFIFIFFILFYFIIFFSYNLIYFIYFYLFIFFIFLYLLSVFLFCLLCWLFVTGFLIGLQYTLISKNVVAVQSNKRQAKTEMNAGLIKVMFSNQTR